MSNGLPKVKVLVVEDERTQRRLLSAQLEQEGYVVLQAGDGQEGVELFGQDPAIRLVITDLSMPRLDGFGLIEAVRAMEVRYTYVIVLTGLDQRDALLRALTLGADDFLHKPVHRDELRLRLAGVERLLRIESQDELVLALTQLAGSRSGETGGHLVRVSAYCKALALELASSCPHLGLTPKMADEIGAISPLHDIGKVGIPDSVLHKHGRLTPEEFTLMQTHTTIGGKILLEVHEKTGALYLRIGYEIAQCHHERWDGRGYPTGLAGEAIPLPARIMALADVFDALTSVRCYKEAFDYERARAIVLAGRGEQFDPCVVDGFLRVEQVWRRIMDDGHRNN